MLQDGVIQGDVFTLVPSEWHKELRDGVMQGDECDVAVFTCWWSRRDEAPRQDGERSKAYERSDEAATGPDAYMAARRIWLPQGRLGGSASK